MTYYYDFKKINLRILFGMIIVVLLCVGNVSAVPVEEWNNTFDGRSLSVQQTSDGGYIIAGAKEYYAWILKSDEDGNKEWENTFNFYDGAYGSPGSASVNSVRQTSDGGYILAGTTTGYWDSKAFIIKTDSNGIKQWDNDDLASYRPSSSGAQSVQQTSDGGFIVAGSYTKSNKGSIPGEILLRKTDFNGNEEWSQQFSIFGISKSVYQTSDGGYIIAGYTTDGGTFDAILIRTDSNGNLIWKKTFGGDSTDMMFSVQQTSDGGYILGGQTSSYDTHQRAWLIKTNEDGIIQWDKIHGGLYGEEDYTAQQTSDGGYILSGTGRSPENSGRRAKLIKTDENGTLEWDWIFGGNKDIFVYSSQQTTDDGYILTGETTDDLGHKKAILIKVSGEDVVAPITNILLSGTIGNIGWYTSDVIVNLTAIDNVGGSGVLKTEYSIDGGASWNEYSVPFMISNEGTTTLSYKSSDNAGNTESTQNQEIKIDKTLPTITISSPQTKDYFRTESLTLNFDALDSISGIDSITSSLDGVAVISGQVVDLETLTSGQHTLMVNVIDKAGNIATKSVTFNLMGIVPAIVNVNPDTLNKASQGNAVTAYIYIELPGYDVDDIDVSTVKLSTNNGMVSALLSPTEVGDYDNDGIPDLMVKFDKQAIIGIVDIGDVVVTISGEIAGEMFEGSDGIHVIGSSEQIPEFPTIAIPVISVIGLMFLFQKEISDKLYLK